MKDNNLIKSIALPSGAAVTNTAGIQLPQLGSRPFGQSFRLKYYTTAGTGANNKNVTVVLQGSNEASANYTNITEFATIVIPEVAASYAASSREVVLPPNFSKSYVRASASGEANGGNAADGTLTLEVITTGA